MDCTRHQAHQVSNTSQLFYNKYKHDLISTAICQWSPHQYITATATRGRPTEANRIRDVHNSLFSNTLSDSIQFAHSFSHIRRTFLWKVHKSSGHALHYIKDLTHWLLLRTQDLIYSGALISVLLQWVAPYGQPIPPSRTFYRCRKCHYCIPLSEYTAQMCPSPE